MFCKSSLNIYDVMLSNACVLFVQDLGKCVGLNFILQQQNIGTIF